MRQTARLAGLLLLYAAPVLAEAPLEAPLPQARPEGTPSAPPAAAPAPEAAVVQALRPPLRPGALTARVEADRAEARRGMICGRPELQGDRLGTVEGPGACGVEDAVRVRSVDGIALSRPLTVNCNTAVTLLDWVQEAARPVLAGYGGGLAQLRVAGGYTCRPRNNRAGNRLSEHAYGHAVDIMGFALRDGTRLTLTDDWSGPYAGAFRALHKAACGPFGTVLGPEANALHHDHFHFDTAARSSGAYCR
ncbi:extensin family protein [Pseudoroseicyclus aestuarii]|uniref:Extensin-like C-terminal domain-containing protein n=1 Tax=Pseudoroseicyclus aestuarii TaxID=1795041 RepID=A0A318SNJ6_9RHOB|nr:extensin family protein [Pseudoroseicyclus aestuarii]PYE82404.1 hypothetical protein DFP88_104160 [Pseudoroseicyclus aestuarii]